jgi:anti-anti-sigma factor
VTVEHHPTQALTIELVPDSRPDVKIIKLTGPLTINNFFDFQEMSRAKPLPRVMLVDLTGVPYIDSAALGSFVGIHVSCDSTGRKYGLVGPNDRLKSLFEMTRTGSFLCLYDSMADAETALL